MNYDGWYYMTRPGLVPPWWRNDLCQHKVIRHHRQGEGQDWQCEGQDSRWGGPRTLVNTLAGKTSCSWPVGSISTGSLLEGPPPTSLRLARQVSAPREPPLTPTGVWATTFGASLGRGHLHHDAWGTDSPRHASAPAGGLRKQLAPTRASMRVCPAARPSHRHHLRLCHTQASPEALKHPLRRAPAYG
jgi:hypothetical protein